MNKTLAIVALVLGVALVVGMTLLRPSSPAKRIVTTDDLALSPVLIKKLELHATLKDGQISGRFFNPDPDVIVTKISIAATRNGEPHPSVPRIFNITATAQPKAMSGEFHVDAAGLDPATHTLAINGAMGKAP